RNIIKTIILYKLVTHCQRDHISFTFHQFKTLSSPGLSHYSAMNPTLVFFTLAIVSLSSAYTLKNPGHDNPGHGHDTMMSGGRAARDYVMRRDNTFFRREVCINKIPNEDCSEAFMSHGFTCNTSEFPFEEKCRKYCEFCV
uniref:Uncharacterized protein n=1 Tax=Clytia hemisphaerica TaxID=252671 RepID=A0A7M5XF91_9CNID